MSFAVKKSVPFRFLGTILCLSWLAMPHFGSLRADPFPAPPALPPADLATLSVSATPERSVYLLGETVRVRYSVKNLGPAPLTLRRDNSTAFWRPESLNVIAHDAATGTPVPASPASLDLFNYRYGRSATLAPGETWTHAFFPLRYVDLPGPGRYRFQLRHTLGWPDASAAPAAPEFVLEFTAPSSEQAAALVTALPPLPEPKDDDPPATDTFGFNHPVYVAPLLRRIAAGEPALLDSLDRMPIPEATAALIELSANSHASVALAARRNLIARLPAQKGINTFSNDVWGMAPSALKDAAWTPAEVSSARTLARSLLQENLPPLDASGFINTWDSPAFIAAALLARLGEASDLPHLARGIQKAAYVRALDLAAYRNRLRQLLGDEPASLRSAYAGLRARGIHFSTTPVHLGEAILAFDEARLAAGQSQVPLFSDDFKPFDSHARAPRTTGPRSSAWLDQLYLLANLRPWPPGPSSGERPGYLGEPATGRPPHPVLLVAALESIPAPLPPECVPFVNFALESDSPHVVHAACAVAVETRSRIFIPALVRVLDTETDPHLRATISKALVRLDDRIGAFKALAADLATTSEPGELLRRLGDNLFSKPQIASQYNRPPLSRTARLALRDAWLAFITTHARQLEKAELFLVGDPRVPTSLFGNHISWRHSDGSAWPAIIE